MPQDLGNKSEKVSEMIWGFLAPFSKWIHVSCAVLMGTRRRSRLGGTSSFGQMVFEVFMSYASHIIW